MILRSLLAVALVLAVPGAGAADVRKTLHAEFSIAESSFDPVLGWDAASDAVIEHIMDPMLEYEYLRRPVKLKPATLERLPEVSDRGATYLCRVRQGIYFAPDAAFKGKPRELVAADYAYSLKRLLDPALKSPWTWLVDGKLMGGDELRARAAKSGRFDYDTALPGLEVVDRYTLRIRLKQPDYNFAYILAMPATAAIAREVVEAYGNDSRFRLPEFDRLYEQARALPDSPERTRIFDRMTDLIVAYAPWKLTHHLLEDHAVQPWVIGYKPHPIRSEIWKYLDVDESKRVR